MRSSLIFTLLVFYSTFLFSQKRDSLQVNWAFNISSNFYFRQLGGALTQLEVPTKRQLNDLQLKRVRYDGPYYNFRDKPPSPGLFISVGAEFIHTVKKNSKFSYSFGVAYNYIKDYYDYTYNLKPYDYYLSSTYTNYTSKKGSGELMNHLARFVFSLNWTSKKDLTFYIRPLNYEMRFIQNKCTAITQEYLVTKSKIGIPSYGASHGLYYQYQDSMQTLTKEYEEPVNFVRSISFCFPTSIGIEQKFHLKKSLLNIGLSIGSSILELYYVPRVYAGICLGTRKRKT